MAENAIELDNAYKNIRAEAIVVRKMSSLDAILLLHTETN